MGEKGNAVAIPEVLAAKGVYLQKELSAETAVTIFGSAQCWPRRSFEQLHFGYEPVPEIYLLHEVFDRFFPPRKYLSQLRDDLADDTDIEIFLEALGCHIIPDDRGRQDISSELGLTLPSQGRSTGKA